MKKRLFFSLLLLSLLGMGIISRPQSDVHADNANMVTIHLDGEKRTIATDARTVQAVLEKVGTHLGEHDKTEPALDETVRGNDFTINVYRARPITVVDGANNYTVMTAERSPRQIAEDAGFSTKQEDEFNFERSDDPFAGAPGTQMLIKRAKTITFDLYGTASQLSTNETTVGSLLEERSVKLEEGDELNLPLEARIVEGMTVSIATVSRSIETVEEEASFTEEHIKDAQQPTSYRKIQTPGKNGKKLVTYETIVRNNGEPARIAIKEVVTEQPVKQVVVVGAKKGTPLTKSKGAGNFTDSKGVTHRETYYDLPMARVMKNCGAGGVYTVRQDGAKVDKDGYVIIAAHLGNYPRCSVVETSLGAGKVYDTGGFTARHPHGFDLATDWTNNNGI